jgi:hypothetical protein
LHKIQIQKEWDAEAFGILLQHGSVRAVLPVNPPTYIVFDKQIEKLKEAGIPFTVLKRKGKQYATECKGV